MDPQEREAWIQRIVAGEGVSYEVASRMVDAALRGQQQDATAQAPREGGFEKRYTFGDVLRTAAQGPTFAFGDEIEAAVTGRNVDDIRSGIEAFREQRPGMALAAEAGASVLPAVGIASRMYRGADAVRRTGFGAQILRGATAGGAAGGAYGVGAGENTGSRVTGGVLGLGTGAALGAGAPVAGATLSRMGNVAKNAPIIREALTAVDEHAWLPKFLKPTQADEVADRLVLRAIAMDGIDEEEALRRLAAGEDVDRLVDLMGENTRRSARGAMAIQNDALTEAKDFLMDRADAEVSRVSRIFDDVLGAEAVNVERVRDGLMARLRSNARDAYEAAYSAQYSPSTEVQRILNQPGIADIAREHQAMVRAFSQETPDMFQFNYGRGGVSLSPRASVRSLDSLKRALDDKITEAYKAGEGTRAGMLREYRDTILRDLDEKVPEYAAARSIYAGDRAVLEAFERGTSTSLRAANGDAMQATVEKMSNAEREMFRLGFLQRLRDDLSKSDLGRDVARYIGVNARGGVRDNTRKTFEALFPDRSTDELFESLQREAMRTESKNTVLTGSRTASLKADMNDLVNADPAETVLRRGLRGGIRQGLDELGEQLEQSRLGEVAGLVADRTVLQDPAVAFRDMVARTSLDDTAAGLLRRARTRGAGSFLGGLLGGYGSSAVGNRLFPSTR